MRILFFIFEIIVIFILLLWFIKKSIEGCVATDNLGIIEKDTSLLAKGLCCILIILSHYVQRLDFLGYFQTFIMSICSSALPLFFLLSSYGVIKSQKFKPLDFNTFVKKRLAKILIPFYCINFVYIIILLLIGCSSFDFSSIFTNPFTGVENAQNLILHQHLDRILLEILGICSIDGVDWFLHVILLSYIFIYICNKIFQIGKRPVGFFLLYSLLIVMIGVLFYLLCLPAHYYRNLWGLILGGALCLFEGRMPKVYLLKRVNVFVILYLILATLLFLCKEGIHLSVIFSLITFGAWYVSLIVLNKFNIFFSTHSIRKASFIAIIGMISYEIYLLHGKFLLFERLLFDGWPSFILIVVCTILCSYFFHKFNRKLLCLIN